MFPNIYRMIDGSFDYKGLSFMDDYSSFNLKNMDHVDMPKTLFMSSYGNYNYNAMPFGRKKY